MALDKDLRDAQNFIEVATSSLNEAVKRLNSFWEESESSYTKAKEAETVSARAGPGFKDATGRLSVALTRLNDSVNAVYFSTRKRPSPAEVTGRPKAPEAKKANTQMAVSPAPIALNKKDDSLLRSMGIIYTNDYEKK